MPTKKKAAKKKAAKKTALKKAAVPATTTAGIPPSIPLVAEVTAGSMPATINVTFNGGIGQMTASLIRRGVLINLQSISSSANIFFSDVQQGDVITLNGNATGNPPPPIHAAVITISVPTIPATPDPRPEGPIHGLYVIQ
ncbi:hypothetical protein HB364_10460 [Pseudoflavitalea sp. X16]|uniref:hypothetical protein n=1 Tax=Paraflavitalea devenefica TaxID=2716334 RepID=UPI00141DAB47|nr:hypothetical protein [Paraflavitalea devenefica]NII25506.1 hypothetical protein [Paraflavitalea devenefica]